MTPTSWSWSAIAAIGADIGVDQVGYHQRDYAIVATEIRDPLSSSS